MSIPENKDPPSSEIKNVKIVFCNGFECPYCQTYIAIPESFQLIRGFSSCPHCFNKFKVSFDKAKEQNKRKYICQSSQILYGNNSEILEKYD
jgi:hypothetical protein